MKVLVLGANGATGINVVSQLLKKGFSVKALARNTEKLEHIKDGGNLEIIKAGISEMEINTLGLHLNGVDAVISCLGHNITLKGIFGKPRLLVTDAVKKIVTAVNEDYTNHKVKIILMNTTACRNTAQKEKSGAGEYIVMALMRALLPPQRDNEAALEYLFNQTGKSNKTEWIAVRPDTLINEAEVTEYTVHTSPVRSPVFNAGKTSRINVADFMVRLLKDELLWEEWKFKTPVVYNRS